MGDEPPDAESRDVFMRRLDESISKGAAYQQELQGTAYLGATMMMSHVEIPIMSAGSELTSRKEVREAAAGETAYTHEPLETIVELMLKVQGKDEFCRTMLRTAREEGEFEQPPKTR